MTKASKPSPLFTRTSGRKFSPGDDLEKAKASAPASPPDPRKVLAAQRELAAKSAPTPSRTTAAAPKPVAASPAMGATAPPSLATNAPRTAGAPGAPILAGAVGFSPTAAARIAAVQAATAAAHGRPPPPPPLASGLPARLPPDAPAPQAPAKDAPTSPVRMPLGHEAGVLTPSSGQSVVGTPTQVAVGGSEAGRTAAAPVGPAREVDVGKVEPGRPARV